MNRSYRIYVVVYLGCHRGRLKRLSSRLFSVQHLCTSVLSKTVLLVIKRKNDTSCVFLIT
ncbi:unnamed protein product [Brugia timori]|uniref:Uncharacterized protein n=1 Tax=Brugia timori TaxID=42155 RepID=A0A0R3R038_9BILA|nr:unnamed protein product [Brugia timori]